METPLVPPREPDPPIGRAREIEYLTSVLNSVEAGRSRACIFFGVPGAGKTTLLKYAHRLCSDRRFGSVFVRAPTMGLPPLFPIGEVVSRLLELYSHLESKTPDFFLRMTEALAGSEGGRSYPIAVPQLVETLERVARIAPLAILFDDYHGAPGEGTSLLLAALRVVEAPVLFLATARVQNLGETDSVSLTEPSGDLWFDHLHLKPLDLESIGQLAENQLESPVLKSIVDLLYTQSQGNPLFASELLRDWQRTEVITHLGGYWGFAKTVDPPLSRSLHEVLSRRLGDLDEQRLELACALALLGREATFSELKALRAISDREIIASLRHLIRIGIVREEDAPPRYQLSHPLYAPTLLASLGGTGQALLHEKIFIALSTSGLTVRSSELAHHAYRSLNRPPELPRIIQRAADEADRVGGYGESAHWYELLAESLRHEVIAYLGALEKQALALSNFSPREAVGVFTKCLEVALRPTDVARLLLGRAKALRHLGQFDEARADLDRALSGASQSDQAAIKFQLAAILGIQGRIEEAEVALEQLAQEPLSGSLKANVLGDIGTAAFMRGDVSRAIDSFLESFNEAPEYPERMHAATNLVWCYMIVGDWLAAKNLLNAAIPDADKRRDDWHLIGLLTDAARLSAWEADFADAMESYVRASRLVARLENPLWEIECLETFGIIQLESGNFREAEHALSGAGSLIRKVVEAREPIFTFAHIAEAKYRNGDIDGARGALEEGRTFTNGNPMWSVSIERVEALCASSEGDYEEGLLRLKTLAMEATQLPFERGKVLESTGEVLAALRRREEAIESFAKAKDLFDRLGAKGRSALSADRIALLKSRRPGRKRRPSVGDFTSREVDVLRLLVRGQKSAEIARALFLSKRTVDKHIERMMDRSNTRTRTELVGMALRQNLIPDA